MCTSTALKFIPAGMLTARSAVTVPSGPSSAACMSFMHMNYARPASQRPNCSCSINTISPCMLERHPRGNLHRDAWTIPARQHSPAYRTAEMA